MGLPSDEPSAIAQPEKGAQPSGPIAVGTSVWLPDAKEGYLPGVVVKARV